ncbi:MAG: hypothetical protein JW709_12130 [Sedimentisphaerales bacterium]|nr:hypothetical protein [Sedimentisphaerales bacterium]
MKIAVCLGLEKAIAAETARKMAQSQQLLDDQDIKVFPVAHGAIGCVRTSDRHSAIPLLREADNGNVLLATGVPIDLHGYLDQRLTKIIQGDYRQAADLLTRLDGAFAAIFWDVQHEKLVVVTDTLGIQPIHISQQNGNLLLATELKAFGASGQIKPTMNPAGWGAFISLGFLISDLSQMADVKRMGPATVLICDGATGKVESSRYWSWPQSRPDMKLADVDTAEMLRVMQREVEAYAAHSRKGVVLMSGGFDSRLILAHVNRAQLDYQAMVLNHPEQLFGADARLACRIARKLNCRQIEVVAPERDYYASKSYLEFLLMNEIAIPSMNLYITPHVAHHIQSSMTSAWEGLGPGFAFAPAYPLPGGFATYQADRCKDRDSLHWQTIFSIFADGLGQAMYDDFRQAFTDDISQYADDDFGVAKFQMSSQMRRGLSISPLMVYANRVLPFTPCLSKAMWNLAAQIPRGVTAHHQLYLKIFAEFFPEASSVPFCSGSKFFSYRSFTPDLWAWKKLGQALGKCRYYGRRLGRTPLIGSVLRGMGVKSSDNKWTNDLLDTVIRQVSPDDTDLNADTVRCLQQKTPPFTWSTRLARRMLFYRQMWLWIMEGRLTPKNLDTLLARRRL